MKKSLSLLLLLALLGGLAGCGTTFEERFARVTGHVPNIRSVMGIEPGDLTGLDGMLETADGSGTADGAAVDILSSSAEGNGTTITLLETLGDGNQLHIVYALTLPQKDEQPTNKELTALLYLEQEISPLSYRERSARGLCYDPVLHRFYCLASFSFQEPGYTGQTLTLRIHGEEGSEQPGVDCSVTWTPNNHAPSITVEDKGGSCTISPLALNVQLPISLDEAEGVGTESSDPMENLRLCLKLVYRDGSVLENFDGGWEDAPIRVIDAKPPGVLFRLDALDYVEFLDYTFTFNTQEGSGP